MDSQEVIELIIAVAAIVAAYLVGRDSGKKSSVDEVVDNAKKHKQTNEVVDAMSTAAKREQLRKYTRK